MPNESPLEVLIVEDDADLLFSLTNVLGLSFSATPFFYDSFANIETLPKKRFDWAIIDGLNGRFPDVAERLRPTCGKILILTAGSDYAQQARDLGYDVKMKPIAPSQLIEYLEH
jgi:DNA-binding response OmpR family regulator